MLWITLEGLLCRGFNVEMLRKVVDVARDVRHKMVGNTRWILCTTMQLDHEYIHKSLGVLRHCYATL